MNGLKLVAAASLLATIIPSFGIVSVSLNVPLVVIDMMKEHQDQHQASLLPTQNQ